MSEFMFPKTKQDGFFNFLDKNFEGNSLINGFRWFHVQNPDIFDAFEHLAKQARLAGHKHYSGGLIINIIRWNKSLHAADMAFKIPNDYIALYTRMLMYTNDTFAEFFNTKPMSRLRPLTTNY